MSTTRARGLPLRRLAFISAAVAGLALMAVGTVAGGNGGVVQEIRAATAKYHDVKAARADGFGEFYVCTDENSGKGAMGQHFANGDRVGDPSLDELKPEVLVYQPLRGGGYRLVGVEYVVLADAWDALHDDPPVLFGRELTRVPAGNRYGLPDFYQIHAWIWSPNPRGLFDDWAYWAPGKGSEVEVDVLLRAGRDFVAIEVKSTKTVRDADLRGLRAIGDLPRMRRRIVVFLGERAQATPDGIEVLPVRAFLRELENGTLFP